MAAAESPPDFAALLERARQGDKEALTELTRRYEPEVRMVARVLLGPALQPHLDTVDLVQSVHRTLMLGIREDRYDISTPERLVALAITLVRRKVAHKWRKLRRQQRLSRGPGESEDPARVLGSLASAETDPGRAAQHDDAVHHVCKGLGEKDRRLLQLRLQGYSTAEAARELGEDADVLRVRLSRLRQRLREAGVLTEWL